MHSEGSARTWLTLLRAPNLGAAALRAQILRHGSAPAALAALQAEPRLPADLAAWLRTPDACRLDADEAWLAAPAHSLLTFDSDAFPPLLRDSPHAPVALFVIGDATLTWLPQLAIVGARNASAGGLRNAAQFARDFVATGFAVTSGLAEGIDGAAHTAALDAGGRTLAVLGTGIDVVYPRQHLGLAQRIAGGGGALVSEFAPGVEGRPHFFPLRNRIIAGLSLATLVVEAGLRSGSLTTARHAAEQGREVFALPGSIHHPLARGCHRLIRDGAALAESAQDVFDALRPLLRLLGLRAGVTPAAAVATAAPPVPAKRAQAPSARGAGAVPAAGRELLALLGGEALALDELVERSGLAAPEVAARLLPLELAGWVACDNGRYACAPGPGAGPSGAPPGPGA